jgi:hypothetical protein
MRGLIIIALAVWLPAAGVLAQTAEPAPTPTPPAADDPSIHSYADRDKTCIAWTDQCRSCERGENDAIFCSNIGIACQPAAITCSRRSEPAK